MSQINQLETKILVLICKKDTNRWEDVTLQSEKHEYQNGTVLLSFKNGRQYRFSQDNFFFSNKPKEINISSLFIRADHKIFRGYEKVIRFDKFYKVFLKNGKSKIIEQLDSFATPSNKDVFGYYQEIVDGLAKQSNAEGIENILANSYSKIEAISEDSVFDQFVSKKMKTIYAGGEELIFPFPFNLSQKKAITNALRSSVSLVQGPPGTGKTQMILNLLSNLIVMNKNIMIVSNNNEAIKNIKERLTKENLGTISALLGSFDNKTLFFEQIKAQDENAFFDNYRKEAIDWSFKIKIRKIDSLYDLENQKTIFTQELNDLELEYEHFAKRLPINQTLEHAIKIKSHLGSNQYLKLKALLKSQRKLHWPRKIEILIKYRLNLFSLDINQTNLCDLLDHYFYRNKITEIKRSIAVINRKLYHSSFDGIKKTIVTESSKYIRLFIKKRLDDAKSFDFTLDNFKENFDKFKLRYPVILSTSFSILNSFPDDQMMDFLIVDEASQSDLLTSSLALIKAKNIIIVGDEQQLPAITNQTIFELSRKLADKYGIEKPYQYHSSNLLQAFRAIFPDAPNSLLKEHYRCDPKIIGFCNRHFYHDDLIINTAPSESHPLIILKTVKGNHARKNMIGSGLYNLREIDEIQNYLENNGNLGSIGIITPFRIQAEKIKDTLKNDSIEVDTVHRFQGREKDTIILSTVVNGINEENPSRLDDFINDAHLLNVAVSRAKKKLILIISEGLFQSTKSNISNLIGYIKYHLPNDSINEGEVSSIFDQLYRQEKQTLALSPSFSFSRKLFLSEKLTSELITNILISYPTLDYAMHVTLNRITNNSSFNQLEQKYLNHPWTHVDFLIFNRVTYRPVLVIEVDGIKYHEQQETQLLRDELKDRSLILSGIPVLRLKTNQSKERDRIVERLSTLIN